MSKVWLNLYLPLFFLKPCQRKCLAYTFQIKNGKPPFYSRITKTKYSYSYFEPNIMQLCSKAHPKGLKKAKKMILDSSL